MPVKTAPNYPPVRMSTVRLPGVPVQAVTVSPEKPRRREYLLPKVEETALKKDPFVRAVEADIKGKATADQAAELRADLQRWKATLGHFTHDVEARLGAMDEETDPDVRYLALRFRTAVRKRIIDVKTLIRTTSTLTAEARLVLTEILLAQAAQQISTTTPEGEQWHALFAQYTLEHRNGVPRIVDGTITEVP